MIMLGVIWGQSQFWNQIGHLAAIAFHSARAEWQQKVHTDELTSTLRAKTFCKLEKSAVSIKGSDKKHAVGQRSLELGLRFCGFQLREENRPNTTPMNEGVKIAHCILHFSRLVVVHLFLEKNLETLKRFKCIAADISLMKNHTFV